MKIPDGPTRLELIRQLPNIQYDTLNHLLRATQQYGDVVRFDTGVATAYFINHPEGVRRVFQENHANYTKNTIQYNTLSTITGRGLLTNDGESWRKQRRLAQPGFARPRLQALGSLVGESITPLITRWQAAADQGQVLDIDREMLRLTLEVVGKALFSIDLSSQAHAFTAGVMEALDHVVYRARHFTAPPDWVPTPRNRRFSATLRALDNVVETMTADRRRMGADQPDDLFTMLLNAKDEETGAPMNPRQVRDEVITLLIAGHETVASALTWTWYLLSLHPAVGRRLQAETTGVLKGNLPTPADLPNLPYTQAVFSEVLRLFPPAWLITRQSQEQDELLGYTIPPKALIIFSPYVLHRRADNWPNPEGFDPERFMVEQDKNILRYTYIPFGAGPRLCIGNSFAQMEAALILASLAPRFAPELISAHPVIPDPLVTIRPKQGLPMRLRPVG